jgi:hypothetical protein
MEVSVVAGEEFHPAVAASENDAVVAERAERWRQVRGRHHGIDKGTLVCVSALIFGGESVDFITEGIVVREAVGL